MTDRLVADRDRTPTAPPLPLEAAPSAPPNYSEDVPSYSQVVPDEAVGKISDDLAPGTDLPPPTYFEAIRKNEETKQ